MSLHKKTQLPLSVDITDKRDVRTQFAALCYREVSRKTQILLISSRRTGRWIIPKGWPLEGRTPSACALNEAWEEAGVTGKVTGGCLALYTYLKHMDDGDPLPCAVMVYPVKVSAMANRFPEVGQRKRKWLTPKRAAERVKEPELSHLLRRFNPRHLPR
ncbi:MAG: NUDIX hydrolase [Pseudomonadota bacterium]